jgi:hypothetical protein
MSEPQAVQWRRGGQAIVAQPEQAGSNSFACAAPSQ